MTPKALLRSALQSSLARRDTVKILSKNEVNIKLRDGKKHKGLHFVVRNVRDRRPKHSCLVLHKEPKKEGKLSNSNVLVWCDCGWHTFYAEYALTKHGASWIENSNGQPPVERNPKLRAWTCYHITSVLYNIVKKGL